MHSATRHSPCRRTSRVHVGPQNPWIIANRTAMIVGIAEAKIDTTVEALIEVNKGMTIDGMILVGMIEALIETLIDRRIDREIAATAPHVWRARQTAWPRVTAIVIASKWAQNMALRLATSSVQ